MAVTNQAELSPLSTYGDNGYYADCTLRSIYGDNGPPHAELTPPSPAGANGRITAR